MKFRLTIPAYIPTAMRSIFAHYGTITFVLVILTLIYCVYSIQIIMSAPTDMTYRNEQLQKNTKTSFDKQTIDKVEQLRTTEDVAPITLPGGRLNPFAD